MRWSCCWPIPRYCKQITGTLGTHYSVLTSWWRHQMEKKFPRYWPFVRGIHRWSVDFPHKGQWRGALVLSLICAWINAWVNNRGASDLRWAIAPIMTSLVLMSWQNGPHFTVITIKFDFVFLYENCCTWITIWPNCLHYVPIDNKSALV